MREKREGVTWDDCIQAADQAIAELAQLMNRDPLHGELYQQGMAVMLYRKAVAIAMRREQNDRLSMA